MNQERLAATTHVHRVKKERTILKAIGSVLFALVASAHHWLHMLLIALGLTTLGAGLFSLSPTVKIIMLLVSLAVSVWFIAVAKRKWNQDRPAAWVYLISSLISIAVVVTAIPQTIAGITQPQKQQQNMNMNNMNMNDHSDMK